MADAKDAKEMSDAELAEAVDRLPLTIIDESHPVIAEWAERSRAQRRLEKLGYQVTREEAIRISRDIRSVCPDFHRILSDAIETVNREGRQVPTKWSGEPTDPAGIRALSEVLMAWQDRQHHKGDERDRYESSWLNVMDGRLADIKDAYPENRYARVADLAAVCLTWLQRMEPDEDEATLQSEDE